MFRLKYLTLSILLMCNAVSYANDSLINQEVIFLIEQKNFYELSQDANLTHLGYFKKCLLNENDILIKKYFIDPTHLQEIEIDCKIVIPKIFSIRIQHYYSRLRLVMSLMKPKKVARLSEQLTYPMQVQFKINTSIEHPDNSSIVSLPFDINQPDILSPNETTEALELFNYHTNTNCKKYKKERLPNQITTYALVLKENLFTEAGKSFCEPDFFLEIKRHSHSKVKAFYRHIEQNYNLWLETRRIEMRNEYKKEYYKLLNQTPYFLLLTSQHPKEDELFAAIEIIHQIAYNSKNQTINYVIDKNINQRVKLFKYGSLNDTEKKELQNDLIFFFEPTIYKKLFNVISQNTEKNEITQAFKEIFNAKYQVKQPVIDYLIDHKINTYIREDKIREYEINSLKLNLEIFAKDDVLTKYLKIISQKNSLKTLDDSKRIQGKTEEYIEDKNFDHMLTQAKWIGGALLTCILPTGRLLKYFHLIKSIRGVKLFRTACFLGLGIPLNSYFILHSSQKYQEQMTLFLSSADGKYLYKNYNSLNDTSKEVLLTTLFLGIGVGPVSSMLSQLKHIRKIHQRARAWKNY